MAKELNAHLCHTVGIKDRPEYFTERAVKNYFTNKKDLVRALCVQARDNREGVTGMALELKDLEAMSLEKKGWMHLGLWVELFKTHSTLCPLGVGVFDGSELPQGTCSEGVGKVIPRKSSKAIRHVEEEDDGEVRSPDKAPHPTQNPVHTSSKPGTGSGAVRSFQSILLSQDQTRQARDDRREKSKEDRDIERKEEQRLYDERRQERRQERREEREREDRERREKSENRLEMMTHMSEMNRQTTLMIANIFGGGNAMMGMNHSIPGSSTPHNGGGMMGPTMSTPHNGAGMMGGATQAYPQTSP